MNHIHFSRNETQLNQHKHPIQQLQKLCSLNRWWTISGKTSHAFWKFYLDPDSCDTKRSMNPKMRLSLEQLQFSHQSWILRKRSTAWQFSESSQLNWANALKGSQKLFHHHSLRERNCQWLSNGNTKNSQSIISQRERNT